MPRPLEITRYPEHWYHNRDQLHCIVPDCGFVTPSIYIQLQWHQLDYHCTETPGAEHKVLKSLLHQSCCAIDGCQHLAFRSGASKRLRALFAHEESTHGSLDMSHICSFVKLAREGRILSGRHREPEPHCERLTFFRMMEKIQALPVAAVELLFRKSGFHNLDQQTPENMGRILTADPLAQHGESPPYWWPVRVDNFLWLCRPIPNDPVDELWRILWTRLRAEYADGRI